ncbi:hypothetical protein [Clostridium felsineum]|uniref:Uncharacterized protein n=1 Tax=Clostridium felsineum TaxID=36839 RepID=A0A1S8LYW9_9CLOT|nr:hypothetical protein [Clostridium felsineum]URZ09087.1 hypothetical protein CLROS_045030 [Clostridium felsineum]URZ13774.1 hypothetical protein CROST_045520 [Clostridium felsineum]
MKRNIKNSFNPQKMTAKNNPNNMKVKNPIQNGKIPPEIGGKNGNSKPNGAPNMPQNSGPDMSRVLIQENYHLI